MRRTMLFTIYRVMVGHRWHLDKTIICFTNTVSILLSFGGAWGRERRPLRYPGLPKDAQSCPKWCPGVPKMHPNRNLGCLWRARAIPRGLRVPPRRKTNKKAQKFMQNLPMDVMLTRTNPKVKLTAGRGGLGEAHLDIHIYFYIHVLVLSVLTNTVFADRLMGCVASSLSDGFT